MLRLSRRKALRFVPASFAATGLVSCITPPRADAETRAHTGIVAVGGVDGFEALVDPTATARLRATGRARLYVHDYRWQRLDPSARKAIVQAFKGTGPAWLEVGESRHSSQFWDNHFSTYSEAELVPDQAHVNLITGTDAFTVREWRSYVDAGRARGLKVVAPIFSPNAREWETSSFRDKKWDELKDMALYGGGLTLDTPPWYLLSHPQGYRTFVEDEVRWCKSVGIQSAWILSPPRTATGVFLSDVKSMVGEIRASNALPNCYVVENYMASPPSGFRFVVGRETAADTVCSVALWVVQHAS